MSFLADLEKEPWRFDFFSVMRRLERSFPDRPRIGDSASRRDEFVMLGQDPFMDFPASNLSRVEVDKDRGLRVYVKFLGLLGPQGALPLATTEEACAWNLVNDDAFARFLDLFNHRFLQLFFRAWADARPIAQHDRPKSDRFQSYVGSMIGLGSTLYRNLDSVADAPKVGFAGLIGAQARSASRLSNFLGGLFGIVVEIDEFVGTHLALDAGDVTRLGQRPGGLGTDTVVGASIFSVQDKIRIRIYTRDLAEYSRFLPTGDRCKPLTDMVFFYIGEQLDWDVELAIPSGAAQPVRLGTFGQLGWTTWIAPDWSQSDQAFRCDARFHTADRMKQARALVR